MPGSRRPPADQLLSQAETFAGDTSAFQSPARGTKIAAVPDFPVKDWDRYEFLRFLGQGGMGMVFLARDRKLGREVAIKFVRLENEHHLQRFMVEARAQARVDHPNVCKVFEVGEVEGKVFITMQAIAGASFDLVPGLTLEQKVIALRDAAKGVHEAHRVGIIHRDLKPTNIMIERADDDSLRTYVMDFGLAHEWDRDVTETGSVLGTPAYMSPEQARGEVSRLDRRTDIYSLGATLYHLTTGRTPVTGANPLEVLSAIGAVDVPPLRAINPDIPRDLEAIILKCLERERSRRYDSAKALADDLERFLAGEPVQARRAGLIYRTHRRFMRHKALAVTGTVAFVLVLMALGVTLKTRRDAGLRERLAQQFTRSMGRIESMARYSALAPLHDIRPDLQAVRAHMGQLQEEMNRAGAIANGPGHYALGRGYWTLDDGEKAREHLQMAWDAGFREPRAAYALGLALGHQYQEGLLEAERIPFADEREARKRDLEVRFRQPALALLRQARGADAPSPAYLEALVASYEGRLDEAVDRLRAVEDHLPWFYEAPLLRGSLLQARAWRAWNQGNREGAQADFEAGRQALAAAAAIGRSAPAAHAAMADLELNALIMEKYGQGRVEQAFLRGRDAARTALAAQADHVPSLIVESALLGELADFRTNRGDPAGDLVQEAVTVARKAMGAGPARADARIALGIAYYQWGSARQEKNLDPTEQLAQGQEAFEALSPEKRDYRVENHLGLIHQTWSDFLIQNGQDPSLHLSGAIAAYERATQMEPHLLPAWINLGTCLQQRASLPRAADPEADLGAALKVLDTAQALNPKHFVPYFVRGKVLLGLALRRRDRGEDPEPELRRSVEASRQGLAINASVPHMHNGMGLAQLELARWTWESGGDPGPQLNEARGAYLRAMRAAPNQVHGFVNLGDLLIQQARWGAGPRAEQALLEAERTLQKALSVSPGTKEPLINLGRVQTGRIELALRGGGDPGQSLAKGEAALAKALRVDARNQEALLSLGELRSANLRWRALVQMVERRDFDQAAEPLRMARQIDPISKDIRLALSVLCLARARWERASGQDPEPSLAEGRALILGILKERPAWSEALALRGALLLEEALGLGPVERGPKAMESLQSFIQAFTRNKNLRPVWKATAERAQQLR